MTWLQEWLRRDFDFDFGFGFSLFGWDVTVDACLCFRSIAHNWHFSPHFYRCRQLLPAMLGFPAKRISIASTGFCVGPFGVVVDLWRRDEPRRQSSNEPVKSYPANSLPPVDDDLKGRKTVESYPADWPYPDDEDAERLWVEKGGNS